MEKSTEKQCAAEGGRREISLLPGRDWIYRQTEKLEKMSTPDFGPRTCGRRQQDGVGRCGAQKEETGP